MTGLLERLLPILILILIGMAIRKTKLLSEETIGGLKKIIVNITLPAVLFHSFSTMDLEVSYLLLFVLIFLFCCALYLLGELAVKVMPKVFSKRFTGGYFTGFEFGMIGVGLFGALWGTENLPVIMLIGFGHELFIWFFYVPLITLKSEGNFDLVSTVKDFLRTPTILAIITGVVFNLTGMYEPFGKTLIGSSIYVTVDFLIPLTSPLILIVIGYAMSIGKVAVKEALTYIVVRWVLVLGIGIPLLVLIQNLVTPLDPLFPQAYFAFMLLPAPYILPLFIGDREESDFFSQLLVYSTMTSFVGYILLLMYTI